VRLVCESAHPLAQVDQDLGTLEKVLYPLDLPTLAAHRPTEPNGGL
jgi:hypothetical protein